MVDPGLVEADAGAELAPARAGQPTRLGPAERHEQQAGLVDVAVVAVDHDDLGVLRRGSPPQPVRDQRAAGAAAEDDDPFHTRRSRPGALAWSGALVPGTGDDPPGSLPAPGQQHLGDADARDDRLQEEVPPQDQQLHRDPGVNQRRTRGRRRSSASRPDSQYRPRQASEYAPAAAAIIWACTRTRDTSIAIALTCSHRLIPRHVQAGSGPGRSGRADGPGHQARWTRGALGTPACDVRLWPARCPLLSVTTGGGRDGHYARTLRHPLTGDE